MFEELTKAECQQCGKPIYVVEGIYFSILCLDCCKQNNKAINEEYYKKQKDKDAQRES